MKPKIAIRKKYAAKLKEQDVAKKVRDANYKNYLSAPAKKKRIKSPMRAMGKPPRDLSTRAEFFRDCKPSEVHQRKLEYQEYCEEVLEHPRLVPCSNGRVQCAECGKVIDGHS